MTSMTLEGATGARLGRVRVADSTDACGIYWARKIFVVNDAVNISERQLREIFATLRSFWPPQDPAIIDAIRQGEYRPKNGVPDVGFHLTGDVGVDEGFVISWAAGTIRGTANGYLIVVQMDPSIAGYDKLRVDIDDLIDRGSSSHTDG